MEGCPRMGTECPTTPSRGPTWWSTRESGGAAAGAERGSSSIQTVESRKAMCRYYIVNPSAAYLGNANLCSLRRREYRDSYYCSVKHNQPALWSLGHTASVQ